MFVLGVSDQTWVILKNHNEKTLKIVKSLDAIKAAKKNIEQLYDNYGIVMDKTTFMADKRLEENNHTAVKIIHNEEAITAVVTCDDTTKTLHKLVAIWDSKQKAIAFPGVVNGNLPFELYGMIASTLCLCSCASCSCLCMEVLHVLTY